MKADRRCHHNEQEQDEHAERSGQSRARVSAAVADERWPGGQLPSRSTITFLFASQDIDSAVVFLLPAVLPGNHFFQRILELLNFLSRLCHLRFACELFLQGVNVGLQRIHPL